MFASTTAAPKLRARLTRVDLGTLAGLSLLVVLGTVAALYPMFVVWCFAAAAILLCCRLAVASVRRARLELWQILAVIALSGYLVLNYGFENLAFHVGGLPIIISYGLMFGALALVVCTHWNWVATALKEPAVVCVLALVVLSVYHLLLDVPSYGVMALRDSSMCVDGLFMLLGIVWAKKKNSTSFFAKWMTVVFVLNLLYSYTLPWAEKVWSWSPESGVFLRVPLFGNYNGTGDFLMMGSLFCICIGGYVIKRPPWLMTVLAVAQFLGIAITQVRRMYVATVIVLLILVVLGETKKFAKALILFPSAVIIILLVTTVGGLEISGRIGPVKLDFFKEHFRSLSDAEGTPGSSVESRFSMVEEALPHFLHHPLIGEGFGQSLLTEMDHNMSEGNNAVGRTPHNSTLTLLARLGTLGFIFWVGLHWAIIKKLIYALRQRHRYEEQLSAFVLWFFLCYLLFMMSSFVEGLFEFPSGAIPFYFLMGFALGLIPKKLGANQNRVPVKRLARSEANA